MGNILAGTYSDRRVDWTTSKLSQKKKEQNRAKRILSNASGETNYKSYLGVAIPENPTQADINEANGILGRPIKEVSEPKQSGGMIGQYDMSAKKQKAPKKKKIPQYYKGGGKVKKNYAYGGRVAKYKE